GRSFPGASRRDRAKNEPAAPRPIRSYRSTRDLFPGPYGFIEPCRGTTYARGSPTNTGGEGIHCSCQSGEIEPIIGMSPEGGRNLLRLPDGFTLPPDSSAESHAILRRFRATAGGSDCFLKTCRLASFDGSRYMMPLSVNSKMMGRVVTIGLQKGYVASSVVGIACASSGRAKAAVYH